MENNSLNQNLRIWKEMQGDPGEKPLGNFPHLSEEALYQLAEKGGIKKGDRDAVEHLSHCPICMKEWVAWREAIRTVDELDDEEEAVMSYGMLKAAATHKPMEPLSQQSGDERFRLGVLPEIDRPTKGMITLDAVVEAGSFEGRRVFVRDRKGRVLLEGKMHDGRLARLCDDLSQLDLSTWTVYVE